MPSTGYWPEHSFKYIINCSSMNGETYNGCLEKKLNVKSYILSCSFTFTVFLQFLKENSTSLKIIICICYTVLKRFSKWVLS